MPARGFDSPWNIKIPQETNGWLLIQQMASIGLARFHSLGDKSEVHIVPQFQLSWVVVRM